MARKHPWLVPAAVLGAWLVFALMVLAISWGGAATRNRPFDLANNLTWNLGWLLWAGATFGVRVLARRYPIERRALTLGIVRHVAWGVAVTLAMLGLEFALNVALGQLFPASVRPNPFVGYIAYKFHVYFLIYGLIVGVSGAYDYYVQLQRTKLAASELEAQLAQAQLQALKMQLHPHFLFNTHHAIISLMLKQENASAIKMLTRLSDLLRLTLRKTELQVSPLREELEMLELYLGIQRERYRERLEVEIRIDPEAENAEMPCLLLQPIVENAVQHGIDPQVDGGRITLDARREGDLLRVIIRDNGPGLPPAFALERASGVGLANTCARLRRLYGSRQSFEISSPATGGTEVRLTLPFRPAAASALTVRERATAGIA